MRMADDVRNMMSDDRLQGGLPIEKVRESFMEAMAEPSPRVLLRAPTGSGKSTGIPPMMLEAGLGERGMVLVVQPRRMAARLLARYVARKSGSELGREIGYMVRFERCISSATRLAFVTDGVLERRLTDNPDLSGVSAVVFDEFHERRLAGDLSLGRVLDLQEGVRPDLAVVVMSATLEVEGLQEFMGVSCRVLEASGRQFPVEVAYRPAAMVRDGRGNMVYPPVWEQAAAAVATEARKEDCGNMLVFMPGGFEIRKTVECLEGMSALKGWEIVSLHGSLSPEMQNRAVEPGGIPRVIVSTNVAETSLTIEGVRTVIDSGLARHAGWDARRGMDTLLIEKIARAAADQRAGRAGRVAAGRCIRLWSEADHARRSAFETPEVLRVDLSSSVLNLKLWGVDDASDFRWLTSPDSAALKRAEDLLGSLGALDAGGKLTPVGRAMLRYPLAPRLARLMVAGREGGCLPEMAAVAALIQSESVAVKGELQEVFREKDDYTDFQAEWRAALRAEACRFDVRECSRLNLMGRACREVLSSYRQLLQIGARGGRMAFAPEPDFSAVRKSVVRGLVESFADSLGTRNGIASNTCRLVGGRGGRISSGSVAMHGLHFVAADVSEVGGRGVETRIGRCTLVDPAELKEWMPSEVVDEDGAVFDDIRRRVVSRRRMMFRDLVLVDREQGDADPAAAAAILAEKVADGTLKLTHWDDSVEQWSRRLNGLRQWMPELELPGFVYEDKIVAMGMLCDGAVGYKDIKDREVMPVLHEWLSHWQREALDKFAPVSLSLSNGQHAKVRYAEDSTPVIALTVQRLFGVMETPLIADRRVPVRVEVLAPNQRPWQITASLESFWKTGYTQMRKDLAGRYPRHKWPPEAPGL